MIIGLTGGIGSGKSTVAGMLAEYGFKIIDADKIARGITVKGSSVLPKIASAFGSDVILPDGNLDRKLLASRAFSTKENTERLNSITGPQIHKECMDAIDYCRKNNIDAVYDCPLLFESGYDSVCDINLLVTVPLEIRIARVISRDNTTREAVLDRISKQMSDDEKIKRADYVISNGEGLEELEKSVSEAVLQIKNRKIK